MVTFALKREEQMVTNSERLKIFQILKIVIINHKHNMKRWVASMDSYTRVQTAFYMKKPTLIQMAAYISEITGNLNTSSVLWKVNIFSNMLAIPMAYDFMFSSGSNPIATKSSLLFIVYVFFL